ncbi:MAG: TIGR02391 family protein [Methylocella sp.]
MDAARKLATVEQARTLSEAQRRAQELRADLTTRGVHPDVLRFCREELLADNYFHAVMEAVKSVAAKLRARTGLTDDGAALVDPALTGDPPMLAINPLKTESEKGEQKGFTHLLRGTFGMFRNPAAHEARINWPMTKDDAEDLFSLVSLIHRRLDAAHMPPRV